MITVYRYPAFDYGTTGVGKWAVISSGSSRASRVVPTQSKAIEIALEQAKRSGGELYIHDRNGRIRERNTYGKDPHPPKG